MKDILTVGHVLLQEEHETIHRSVMGVLLQNNIIGSHTFRSELVGPLVVLRLYSHQEAEVHLLVLHHVFDGLVHLNL